MRPYPLGGIRRVRPLRDGRLLRRLRKLLHYRLCRRISRVKLHCLTPYCQEGLSGPNHGELTQFWILLLQFSCQEKGTFLYRTLGLRIARIVRLCPPPHLLRLSGPLGNHLRHMHYPPILVLLPRTPTLPSLQQLLQLLQ